ncbi:MAG: hypothetical protein H6811_02735 [Phycisphaeraceae bacterium]|nr:hypothetical protein [Phycisphaeraceae bacterium]
MSILPTSLARVPNLLISRLTSGSLARTNIDLARIQEQLATGLAISRPSQDSVKAATISLLNERLERAGQIERNLQHAQTALSETDVALGDANDLLLEAKQIALSQLNISSGPEEREGQATIVNSLIQGLFSIANREGVAGHILGGQSPGTTPLVTFLGGVRYLAGESGLITDLGPGNAIPLTLGGSSALGQTSARLRGQVDLDPDLTAQTSISALRGARSLGVALAEIEFTYADGPPATIDLSRADTVQDVVDAIQSALSRYEQDHEVEILGPGGVSISGEAITIDVLPDAAGGADPELVFADIGDSTAAADLGLIDDDATIAFTASTPDGLDLAPRLTWNTPIDALAGLSVDLGEIRVNNNGVSRVIDLAGAQTLQDIRARIEGAGLGLRVRIDDVNDRLDIFNEVANGRDRAMSIEEVPGNNGVASALGIRSLDLGTRLDEFNDGRGVDVIDGVADPITGVIEPELNIDFTLTLGDGFEIDIDLAPTDLTNVESLLATINTQIQAQLAADGRPTDQLVAGLSNGDNGIVLTQDASLGATALEVHARNNSPAADQLGLLNGTYDATSATLAGQDRATVRVVDSVFTQLIDLRDSLDNDDTFGIELAASKLEESLARLAETRALVGGYARRIESETRHVEDRVVFDQAARSQLQDLDVVEAASRFTLLQTQLQAGYQSAASINQLTLLNFLG